MKIKIKGVIISNDYKRVYDWFEIESCCPKDIEKQLEALKNGEDIELEVNSPGGDVYAGSEIYTTLKQHPGNIIAKVVGVAASAASVVIMAAKTVLISPTAQIMLHNVWSRAQGDYRAMEHEAGVLKGWSKSIANAYMLKTGMTQTELLNFMNKETWLTAQDAVKYKFADEIMFDEGMQLAASIQNVMLPQQVIDKVRNLIKGAPQQIVSINDFDLKDSIEKVPYLKQVAEAFRNAPRSGASVDSPEGAQYITISDTLATQIANFIDQTSDTLESVHAEPQKSAGSTEPTEEPRQVPVDLYNKLYSDLERRARI